MVKILILLSHIDTSTVVQQSNSIFSDKLWNLVSTIIGGLLVLLVSMYESKKQNKFYKDTLKDKRKFDAYLQLSNVLLSYSNKISKFNDIYTITIENEINIKEFPEGRYQFKEVESKTGLNVIDELRFEIKSDLNQINTLLIYINNKKIHQKVYKIQLLYNELAIMLHSRFRNKKNEFLSIFMDSPDYEARKDYIDNLNKNYLKNDMKTMKEHYNKQQKLILEIIKDINKNIDSISD